MPEVKKEHSPRAALAKPISTSSPAGLAAAQMVTPAKLSSLLLEKGPLAIRHITQTLGTEIPSFKDLSSSKQRRLIMSAMECGDQERSVVFEKIGWGQWSAKPVAPEAFARERDVTNAANAKIKDIVSQESQRRRSSSGHGARKPPLAHGKRPSGLAAPAAAAPAAALPAALPAPQPGGAGEVLYIDENALASDDDDDEDEPGFVRGAAGDDEEQDYEDDDDEDEDEDDGASEEPYSFRRRKSSVVCAEHSDDLELDHDREHELLARRVRPLLQNRSRRSSSKLRTSVSKPHLDLPQPPQLPQPLPLSRHNSNHMIDLEQLTSSISEPSSRRESRVSFSKESSIRSTLFPHKSYLWSRQPPQDAKRKGVHARKRLGTRDHYSDTDEEDWAAIGAASLRNNSVPPRIDTVANSPNGFVAPSAPAAAPAPAPAPAPAAAAAADGDGDGDGVREMPPGHGPETQPRRTGQRSADDNNAAFLLMSLKS